MIRVPAAAVLEHGQSGDGVTPSVTSYQGPCCLPAFISLTHTL